MSSATSGSLVSVIVPVGRRRSDIVALFEEYKQAVADAGASAEFIFVLDGPAPETEQGLRSLLNKGERIKVVGLNRIFGEATALMVGFEHAAGQWILTLPAHHQIQAAGIGILLGGLKNADVVVAHRWPRAGGVFERIRRNIFHGLLRWMTGQRLRDLGCGARAMKREVLEELALYGDQHRFLPILANRQGFRVLELDVPQSPKDRFADGYSSREYAHRILDIFTVFFLTRFTKRPLRFFGMIGVSTFVFGALAVTYLVIDRLVFDHGLANRPALLLSSLLVVLGLQLFALGLLGELIIFTHARDIKDYKVAEIIQYDRLPPTETDAA